MKELETKKAIVSGMKIISQLLIIITGIATFKIFADISKIFLIGMLVIALSLITMFELLNESLKGKPNYKEKALKIFLCGGSCYTLLFWATSYLYNMSFPYLLLLIMIAFVIGVIAKKIDVALTSEMKEKIIIDTLEQNVYVNINKKNTLAYVNIYNKTVCETLAKHSISLSKASALYKKYFINTAVCILQFDEQVEILTPRKYEFVEEDYRLFFPTMKVCLKNYKEEQ